jgi:dihydroorotase
VATLVDQGGPSAMTLPGFRKFVVEPAKSRVVCFISAYLVGGLEGHYYPSLYGPEQVDVKATVNAALENRDIVKGIKAHGEIGGASRWGVEVMRLAKEISREAGLPLYVHLGQIWPTKDNAAVDPNAVVRDVVALMQAGDVLAHPFTRHPGGFISEETGKVHPVVWDALERGVRVDVGHGSHFSFKMARMALEQGIVPYTLGADLHGYNVTVPGEGKGDGAKQSNPFYGVAPFSLCHAMTELMTLGMPFFEVVKMVTSHAAELIGMSETVGTLAPGRDADVSVIDRVPGAWELRDNSGDRVIAREAIVPRFVLRKGMRFEPDSPILARPAAA